MGIIAAAGTAITAMAIVPTGIMAAGMVINVV
jgi:hypothetical protein